MLVTSISLFCMMYSGPPPPSRLLKLDLKPFTIPNFTTQRKVAFEKSLGKGENTGNWQRLIEL